VNRPGPAAGAPGDPPRRRCNSWIDTGTVDSGVDGSAVLSSLDGVPYVAYLQTDGSRHNLRVARLDGAPAPIGPDDGEGSGAGNDSNIGAKPILPPREQPGPRPAKRGPCGVVREATAGPNTLVGGPRGDCLFGGAGNDTIRAADGRAESVFCGTGIDTVRADRFDRLHGCERVKIVRR